MPEPLVMDDVVEYYTVELKKFDMRISQLLTEFDSTWWWQYKLRRELLFLVASDLQAKTMLLQGFQLRILEEILSRQHAINTKFDDVVSRIVNKET